MSSNIRLYVHGIPNGQLPNRYARKKVNVKMVQIWSLQVPPTEYISTIPHRSYGIGNQMRVVGRGSRLECLENLFATTLTRLVC